MQLGNSAPFMTRELKKGIYSRTRLKKQFNKNPTKENELKFKKQRNKCVSLRKKAIKQHFKQATESGLVSNRAFWNPVKPFLSKKGGLAGSDISLVKNNEIVTEDKELTESDEGVVAQWCNPPTLKPEQSGGVGSSPGRTPSLELHDKGSRTRLGLLYFCDPSAWR